MLKILSYNLSNKNDHYKVISWYVMMSDNFHYYNKELNMT